MRVQEHDLTSENPYEALGVPSDSNRSQIKVAFLKLSKIYHPDVGGAVADFQKVQWAYKILSNEESRKLYDETGSTAAKQELNIHALMAKIMGEQLSKEGFEGNIIQTILLRLDNDLRTYKNNIREASRGVQTLNRQRGRVRNDEEYNIFDGYLDEQIQGAKKQIAVFEKALEEIQMAIEGFKNYEDTRPTQNHGRFS